MDFRQIRHFVAIADAGSLNRAAAALRVSQPSLSVSMRNLERDLGESLLTRGSKGVTLTLVGQTFLIHARSILREAEKAVEEVRRPTGQIGGRVTVGLMSAFSALITPAAIESFRKKYPAVEVVFDVSTHTGSQIKAALAAGSWDFGFVLHRDAADYSGDIVSEPIAALNSGVYAASAHQLAQQQQVSLLDMAGLDWVVSSLTAGAEFLTRKFQKANLPAPNIKLVSNSFGLMSELVARSTALCMLPHRYVEDGDMRRRLAQLRQHALVVTSRAGLVRSARTAMTPAARLLIEEFRAAAAS